LLELDGKDLRLAPLEARRAALTRILREGKHGLRPSDQVEADGATVYRLACELGAEGIISKLKGSRYRSGRTRDWIKCKNPDSPAVKRQSEEDWGR
jgi:bifunctional non-homologous end joining protein LigD